MWILNWFDNELIKRNEELGLGYILTLNGSIKFPNGGWDICDRLTDYVDYEEITP
jgi:hypothetical protein